MCRACLPVVLAACGAGGPPVDSERLPDVTVVRNTLEARSAELDVSFGRVRDPLEVRLTSSDPEVLPDQVATCDADPCRLVLTPSADRTAQVDVVLDAGDDTRTFTLHVVPRWVRSASDAPAATDTLRGVLDAAEPGDVIGFDPDHGFGSPQTIPLQDTLEVVQTVTLEGPGPDQLTVTGSGLHGLVDVGPGGWLTLSGMTLAGGVRELGGAIAAAEGTTVDVADCRFTGSSARTGGAIHTLDAELTVDGCRFDGNEAGRHGGAIAAIGSTVAITDSAFGGEEDGEGNVAERSGGAVYTSSGSLTLAGSTFAGNEGAYGGAVYTTHGDYTERPAISVVDTQITSTSATAAALWLIGDATLRNVTIDDNDVDEDVVYLSGGTMSLAGVQVAGNRTVGGGAVRAQGFLTVMQDCRIVGNVASGPDSRGGGVRASSDVTIEGGEISGNVALEGGGVWVAGGAEATLRDVVVAANGAKGTQGGGVFVDGSGDLIVEGDTRIVDNLATGDRGGGVHVAYAGTFDFRSGLVGASGDVGGNRARWGGGIYSQGITTLHADANVSSNVASDAGGGLFLANPQPGNGTVALLGATISGNTAGTVGGGVYIGDKTNLTATALSSITGNQAGDGGGGIYLALPPPEDVVQAVCVDLAGRVVDNVDGKGSPSDVDPISYCL